MRIVILFLLISATGFAQQEDIEETTYYIGELRTMQEVDMECTRVGSVYTFNTKDTKSRRFAKYKSFSFEKNTLSLDSLYAIVLDGFVRMPKEHIIVPLDNYQLELDYSKSGGNKTVRFIHFVVDEPKDKCTSVWMTKSRINKLFGKK